MRCGPTTALGNISGSLLPSCAYVMPLLKAMGVETELWMGETDSRDAMLGLFAHPNQVLSSLLSLSAQYPQIKGFNFDLEVSNSTHADVPLYAAFLQQMKDGLNSYGVRLTADVSCGEDWAPVIGDCALLEPSVDKVLPSSDLDPLFVFSPSPHPMKTIPSLWFSFFSIYFPADEYGYLQL